MYTAEIYKLDGRVRSGERLVLKEDFNTSRRALKSNLARVYPENKGYRVEIHDTFVTRVNAQSGREYRERYDTPRSCSPASDLYWSM
jgi:hypothetical protein